jgi:enoyl-CoA hydratase
VYRPTAAERRLLLISYADDVSDLTPLVRLEIVAPRATITLDSPDNRNALSRQLVDELMHHLELACADTSVRAILIAHTGSTFCSGADMAEALDEGMEEGSKRLLALLAAVASAPVPVVAVVQGHARAGGLGLVGACDFAVSSSGATYAFTEVRLGLAPAIISLTTRFQMTDRDAQRKYLTGATFDGFEAARSGLVTEACEPDQVDHAVDDLVDRLAKTSRQGLAETKRLLNHPVLERIAADGPGLARWSAELFASEAARSAMAAFRSRKRAPR